MALKTKKLTIYITSDGKEYSPLQYGGSTTSAKASATTHENRLQRYSAIRKVDSDFAKLIGIELKMTSGSEKGLIMSPDAEKYTKDNSDWYEDMENCKDAGVFGVFDKLDRVSTCPDDAESAGEIIGTLQGWIKVLGGLDNIKKLAEYKLPKGI